MGHHSPSICTMFLWKKKWQKKYMHGQLKIAEVIRPKKNFADVQCKPTWHEHRTERVTTVESLLKICRPYSNNNNNDIQSTNSPNVYKML